MSIYQITENDIKAFDKARREYKEGKTISLKSIKDVERLFRSL